jgi:predicted dehydrogenase
MENKKQNTLSRRKFVGRVGTATAAFTIVPKNVISGLGYKQPSDLLNIAAIGVGNRGSQNLRGMALPDVQDVQAPSRGGRLPYPYTREQLDDYLAGRPVRNPDGSMPSFRNMPRMDPAAMRAMEASYGVYTATGRLVNIYALCDVEAGRLEYNAKSYPKAKTYQDWRELLEKEKSIDGVLISTPDHNHATIAAHFIREKKHVYCEKPLTKTITEARTLAKLAKEYDVVTQMGNQGHAQDGTRITAEWLQSGVIGNIHEIYLSTDRPGWPQGNLPRPEELKIPEILNYDLWLGPAPKKPYNPIVINNWRGLWDYGTGAMGDMGAHIFDAPLWALNLDYPVRIQATSSPYSKEFLPQSTWVTYEFAERFIPGVGYMPPVKVTWCDGGLRPPRPTKLEPGRAVKDVTYIGDKGIIMHGSHGQKPELVPLNDDFEGVTPWMSRTKNIYEDWVDAIMNNRKAVSDFSWGSKVTEIMLLTNIALLTKGSNITLEYNSANMRVTNLPEANDYFHYEYREGWSL